MRSKLRSYRPGHGTVVAYVALFMALGGTSYGFATVSTGAGIKTKQVDTGPWRRQALAVTPAKHATMFASIRDPGPSVGYGRGVTKVKQLSTKAGGGRYLVTFDRSLVNCVVQATPGLGSPPGSAGVTGDVMPQVIMSSGGLNQAEVDFFFPLGRNPGRSVNTSFLITAFC
jgi:hypothetical protein